MPELTEKEMFSEPLPLATYVKVWQHMLWYGKKYKKINP